MILRNTSLLSCRAHDLRLLWVALLAVTALDASALSMPQRVYGLVRNVADPSHLDQRSSVAGYLPLMGASPLRFQPLPTPPPPRPAPVVIPTSEPVGEEPLADPEPVPSAEVVQPVPESPPPPAGPKPVSILPDDTPRDLRAEDVLPFFQVPMDPGGGPGATVVVPFTPATPAGATAPPSSATYQLK